MPEEMIEQISHDFALKVGLPLAAGTGIFSTFFASTMIYVVTVQPLWGAASSSVVIGSAAANSSAAGAGWFTSAGVAGVSGATALGIGAIVTVAVGSIVVGVSAAWSREAAKAEMHQTILVKLRESNQVRETCEVAAQAAYASFARNSLSKAINAARAPRNKKRNSISAY